MKKLSFKRILACLFLLINLSTFAQVKLTVSMDSATLLMGNVTPYHIELQEPKGSTGQLVIPTDSMCENVEIASIGKDSITYPGGDRQIINRTILLQSFDSGLYQLRPILYINGNETIASEQLALKVDPVNVDTMQTIHPIADISELKGKWSDKIPDFIYDNWPWIIAGIVILIALFIGYRIWKRYRKGTLVIRKAKLIPPYDEAMQALTKLHGQKLCETGHEKEYYTLLTEILRRYLERRFGINAMEMTSTQIMHQLDITSDDHVTKKYMNDVLQMADFVKFAKVRPMPEDNVEAYNSAVRFVEDTRPTPEPAAEEKDEKSKNS